MIITLLLNDIMAHSTLSIPTAERFTQVFLVRLGASVNSYKQMELYNSNFKMYNVLNSLKYAATANNQIKKNIYIHN